MSSTAILALYLAFFFLDLFWESFLSLLNMRYVRNTKSVPLALAGVVDSATREKSVSYTLARGRFGILASFTVSAGLLAVIFSGYLGVLDDLAAGVPVHPYFQGMLFIATVSVTFWLISLPFVLYSNFGIEARYGFNKMTFGLFLADTLKGTLITTALGVPVLLALFWFMDAAGTLWWIWAFLAISVFQLLINLLYPLVIAPLFNKFTPLAEGALRSRILGLAERLGFRTKGIFVMDGSKRSRHSNAYFTGLGRVKRIVLFDTLVNTMTEDEVVSVLAHEIGHEKKNHVKKGLVVSLLVSLVGFWLLGVLLPYLPLYRAFGLQRVSYHAILVLLAFCSGPFTFFLKPLGSVWSRKHEYQADRFAVEVVGNAGGLKSALIRLSKDNLSNLTPHPLYSFWHYSHPTIAERLGALERMDPAAGGRTGAEGVVWNLGDLYSSPSDPALLGNMGDADARAEAFAHRFKGKIAGLSAAEMKDLLLELEAILELGEKPAAFAGLDWSSNSEDPARGALMQKITERGSRLSQALLFVELEWAGAPEDKAKKFIEDPLLSRWRHWLLTTRRYRPYLLSEPEEKLLKEKSVTGREAWVRFFEENQNATLYEWEGGTLPQQALLSKLYDADRAVRARAAASLTKGLKGIQKTTTYVFNTLLADKASDDLFRGYPTWISSRNMDNQVDDATANALVSEVTSRYDIVARYYRLKKRLLGLDELLDYDRYAPLPAAERTYTWAEAKDIVLRAYGRFHPKMAEIASLFFENKWIDAEARKGKRGGAFSSSAVPSVHPYILMSFQGTANDVMTLAHELGHGVHQYLARGRGILQQNTPLTTAETASTFGESLVFQDMFDGQKDPKVRLALLVREIEGAFATIFRQVAMNRFEEAIHTARRAEGELTTERFNAVWLSMQREMFGDSVTLTDDYGIWWSYIHHFLFAPGYVYAYAFADLLTRALYSRYLEKGGDFPDRFLSILAAGGSDWPHRLMAPLGVDLTDPEFWKLGLGLLEKMVEQAEGLAGAGN